VTTLAGCLEIQEAQWCHVRAPLCTVRVAEAAFSGFGGCTVDGRRLLGSR
jgi:hypothetical protein